MKPTLWGPGLWHILFACAWKCGKADLPTLLDLVLAYAPALLPCEKCREHFRRNSAKATRRLRRQPKSADDVFHWLYFLKDEVSASFSPPALSLSFSDLTQRYRFSGGAVDDILAADTLVLVAISASEEGLEETFCHMASALATLLPLPSDSELLSGLRKVKPTGVVGAAYRACRATRIEHGVPYASLRKMKEVAKEQ